MSDRGHLHIVLGEIGEGFCLAEVIRDASGQPVDFLFIEANAAFEVLTGLRDAAGRRARELLPQLAPEWTETYARVAAGEAMRFETGLNKNSRWLDVFATPVQPEGRFVVVVRDITARREQEREREEARIEAERLLAELNHRVMNTLSMITSIVRLEAQQTAADGESGAQALARLQTRLGAVAVLYRALNTTAAVAEVEARAYLNEIAQSVAGAIADGARVRIDCEVADVTLPTEQAAPLGLLVNELMTNALKYAFPGDREGRIRVTLQPAGNGCLRLTVADDGIGLGNVREHPGNAEGHGIGGLLIEAFAEQIGGRVARDAGAGGTRVAVTFPWHAIGAARKSTARPAVAAVG